MKTQNWKILTVIVAFSLILGCKKVSTTQGEAYNAPTPGIFGEQFSINIPESISSATAVVTGKTATFHIEGGAVYENLRFFINIGEGAAEIVDGIMTAIVQHNLSEATTIDYNGDDLRPKQLVVIESADYEGVTYEFRLTITDGTDTAMQVFWNTGPVKKGVAIVHPYNMDRTTDTTTDIIAKNTRYKIDYSEVEVVNSISYEKRMIVFIAGLRAVNNFDINNMKMWVGKRNGSILDIWGNSNHPSAKILDSTFTGGRNYAFIARADQVKNIGVAEVALPPSTITTITNLFTTYSVYNVLKEEVDAIGFDTSLAIVDTFLMETIAPAYFVDTGFAANGPGNEPNANFTPAFIDLSGLPPYVPNDIRTLTISFQ